MVDGGIPMDVMLEHLEVLANQSLRLWDVVPEGATARLINVSENATYLVEAPQWKSILRVHREGYHTATAINCELAWSRALNHEGGVITPDYYVGSDGKAVQAATVDGLPAPRQMVMFHFVEGVQPDENHDLVMPFEELGEIAAKTHLHSMGWARPEPFERLTWDLDAVFGPNPTWGNWRNAPNVTREISEVLEKVEATIKRRLSAFGTGPKRYGLIHADMRLANLLIDGSGTRLIDFDDCGMGWYLYDFAASISFMEDHPQVPALKVSWVKGYRKIHHLADEDAAELDTFVMLRRLALLAWIGSHIEAPEPQALAPDFARVSAELGEDYLKDFS
ncbi:MAG: phosphotransferase [Gammaproteobacteria bacterium]|nr:phosphotransferase [Gammaproteobacteria bacterium]